MIYRHTKEGLINRIYNRQLYRSRHNGITVEYSYSEFVNWIKRQEDRFLLLYLNWVSNDFKKDKVPSVDRIDPAGHYSLDNIQLVDWAFNNDKGNKERKRSLNKCNQ